MSATREFIKFLELEITGLKTELTNQSETQNQLRELLWLRHGCPPFVLYGDDGEMQCTKCLIDFKRYSIDQIKERFESLSKIELLKKEQPCTNFLL